MSTMTHEDDASVAEPEGLTAEGSVVAKLSRDLLQFYAVPDNFEVLRTVNSSSPPLSLRTIYIYVSLSADECITKAYFASLRRFTRKKFDPFRRCDRVTLRNETSEVTTTEGQMNFFRWVIENGHWNFMIDNSVNVISSASHVRVNGTHGGTTHARRGGAPARSSGKKGVPSGVCTVAGRHVLIFD